MPVLPKRFTPRQWLVFESPSCQSNKLITYNTAQYSVHPCGKHILPEMFIAISQYRATLWFMCDRKVIIKLEHAAKSLDQTNSTDARLEELSGMFSDLDKLELKKKRCELDNKRMNLYEQINDLVLICGSYCNNDSFYPL